MRPEIDAAWDIGALVRAELDRQHKKWGDQVHSPAYWWLIVSEEFGEAAKAMCEQRPGAAQQEIVQTVACLVQTYLELERIRQEQVDESTSRPGAAVASRTKGDDAP